MWADAVPTGVSGWHLSSLETCPNSQENPGSLVPQRLLSPRHRTGNRRTGRGHTDLLDVSDVHQLDDFVPLGGARLGALEAQVATRGGQSKTQPLNQRGRPAAATTAPGDEDDPRTESPSHLLGALAFYKKFYFCKSFIASQD